MRGLYSGWEVRCLAAILLLFLNVPVFLYAQSGSSPQSAPAAASPADALPASTLSPKPLIEKAREAAFEFSEKLPNFICEEFMSRFAQRGREDETPLDVVSAEIIYDDGQESYRNVKINDRPTDKAMEEIGGSWSTGEFASTLLELFNPIRTRSSSPAARLPLRVSVPRFTTFKCGVKIRTGGCRPARRLWLRLTRARVWVDPKTARVLRIEMQARNIPSDFPMDTIESAVDYSYVTIGGTSFLLPVHAESLGCQRGTRIAATTSLTSATITNSNLTPRLTLWGIEFR